MPEPKRPTVDEVLAGAIHTITNILLPSIDDTWARAAANQLVGTLEYARTIVAGDESVDAQVAEVRAAIEGLRGAHPQLAERFPAPPAPGAENAAFETLALASEMLTFAVGATSPGAEAIRGELRPVLVRHANESFSETSTMLMRFAGTPRNA